MKITTHHLSLPTHEITLDNYVTVYQLRTELATKYEVKWNEIDITGMVDEHKQDHGAIYIDDNPDVKIIDLLKITPNDKGLLPEINLTIFLHKSTLGSGHYRPTIHNPKGNGLDANLTDHPDHPFFKAVLLNDNKNGFKARYQKLQDERISVGDLPDELCDPIMEEIMDRPVIVSNQRTYDFEFIQKLNFFDPIDNKQLTRVVIENLRLRSEIESYLAAKEKLMAQKKAFLAENSLFKESKGSVKYRADKLLDGNKQEFYSCFPCSLL